MSIWWPNDGSDEWLSKADGLLAVTLLELQREKRALTSAMCEPVVEIGVWKGAWSSVVLMNLNDIEVKGVDPYPGYESIRRQMLARFEDLGVNERFTLVSNPDDLPKDETYSMIHIDGEHSEQAVETELRWAVEHLADGGIVVVDDFRHQWFPGIASALFRFLGQGLLKMFTVSGNKAYLARTGDADEYYNHLQEKFAGSKEIPVWTHYRQWDGEEVNYIQSPNVCGQRVLICGMTGPTSTTLVRRLAVGMLPPFAVRLIKWFRRPRQR